jgi:hypothetical protein
MTKNIKNIKMLCKNDEPPNPNAHKTYFEVFPSHECQG